jgi:hypothetical protein
MSKAFDSVAGKILSFPYRYPRTTLGVIGGAILAKALSNVSNIAAAGSSIVTASQNQQQSELLRQLVNNTNPSEQIVGTPINMSELMGG